MPSSKSPAAGRAVFAFSGCMSRGVMSFSPGHLGPHSPFCSCEQNHPRPSLSPWKPEERLSAHVPTHFPFKTPSCPPCIPPPQSGERGLSHLPLTLSTETAEPRHTGATRKGDVMSLSPCSMADGEDSRGEAHSCLACSQPGAVKGSLLSPLFSPFAHNLVS